VETQRQHSLARRSLVLVLIRFPDPEFAEAFRAYVNYFEDLAGTIGGLYMASSLVEGVHNGVLSHPPVTKVQRRHLNGPEVKALDAAFRKAWSTLRRLDLEVEDPDNYDVEANAWIPTQAYYAVFHSILGLAIASGQTVPRDHAAALKVAGKVAERGALPPPWDAWCGGCPQTGSCTFGGLNPSSASVHVLSRPEPGTSEDRLAMFLRTTRQKELERRFNQERLRKPEPGRTRRNLTRADKEGMARSMAPTTIFDVLWRMRKKANYEDADTFVLGAAGDLDARRLGQALVIVVDATIAALEALAAAYAGANLFADMADAYRKKTSATPTSALGRRSLSWAARRTAFVSRR
jgi:hypothetical protein